jgi:hypothetical protein
MSTFKSFFRADGSGPVCVNLDQIALVTLNKNTDNPVLFLVGEKHGIEVDFDYNELVGGALDA